MRAGWLALWAAGLSAAGCALDKNGLLDDSVAIDGGGPDAANDGTIASGEGGGPGDDGGGSDGPGGGTGDGAPAGDGAKGDSASQPDVTPPPLDAGPAPLAYDGGVVADPTFSDDAWMKFCVGVTGCFDAGSISACMGGLPQPVDPPQFFPPPSLIGCVGAQGSSCAQVKACFGIGGTCSTSTPDGCNGNAWTTCRMGGLLSVDCAALGMVCSLGSGNAGCGFGDCYAWQEGQTVCAGQYVVTCHQGRYEPKEDCRAVNATCGGSPASCLGVVGCTSVSCGGPYQNGGFKCTVDPAGDPTCALGNQCGPTQADSCDPAGHQAKFCNAGVPAQFDCHGAGWPGDCNRASAPLSSRYAALAQRLTRRRFPIIFRAPLPAGSPTVARVFPVRVGPTGASSEVVPMPKMKTNKTAAKRFRVSGKGRVRRPKAGGNHGMQEKSRKRLRRLRNNDMVDKTLQKHVKRLLPYG